MPAATQGDLHGLVRDDAGQPLPGAVVSALGATTAFAVTDREGRFAFRGLAAGPYLIRAHLQGYLPARGRVVQVGSSARSLFTIDLARIDATKPPAVLAAGINTADTSPEAAEPAPDPDARRSRVAVATRQAQRAEGG